MRAIAGGPTGSAHETDYQALGPSDDEGLVGEYRRVMTEQLHRWGIPADCATVDIQQLQQQGPKDVFVAVVCLASWHRTASLRLLLGLPLLDKKVRQTVQSLWLGDVSLFGGVMLRVASSLPDKQCTAELRQLMVNLTGSGQAYTSDDKGNRAQRPM